MTTLEDRLPHMNTIAVILLSLTLALVVPQANAKREADYVNESCKGEIEFRLPDGTRADCVTDNYAIEYDWAKKWAECIGQALYYATVLNKRPVCVLIVGPKDDRYVKRVDAVAKRLWNIDVWTVKK